jgi:predicted glycoside hydrolase/deacetylase ChbG (UPF0249 family)
MKRLIITGDDYGLCAPVNRAIEECLGAETMGAVCVMTNMPWCGPAATLRRNFPRCSLGVHWNITQGEPVLGAAAVPSLVDRDGRFHPTVRGRWLKRRIRRQEVRAELSAQYERFVALAGAADFWNTHQNVHLVPGLFQLFVEVGRELQIPAMRSHERFTVPASGSAAGYHWRHPGYWLKGRVIRRWSERARAQGTRMPAGRLYLPGYAAGSFSLAEVLDRVPWREAAGALELVIHPATAADSKLLGSLTDSRVREYEMFRDPRLLASARRRGVELVGFEALRQSGAAGEREKAA